MPGFRSLFAQMKERPGLWFGHEPTYRELCAFLMGCEAGSDFALLRGFHEWLVVRVDGGNNLHWIGLLPAAHLPEDRRSEPYAPDDDRLLVGALWDAVTEFLDECSEWGGVARIFERYIRWRDSQPWHDADPVGSLNELEGSIDSPPFAHASDDAHEVHRIRRIPVSSLSTAECTKFVKLWLNIEAIVPRSTQLIAAGQEDLTSPELVELIQALIDLGPDWWADHPNYFADLRRALPEPRFEDDALVQSWAEFVTATEDASPGHTPSTAPEGGK